MTRSPLGVGVISYVMLVPVGLVIVTPSSALPASDRMTASQRHMIIYATTNIMLLCVQSWHLS